MHSNLRFADLGELFRFDRLCHVIEGWGVPFQVRYAARRRRGQGAGGARVAALQYAPHRSLCDDAARAPAHAPFDKCLTARRLAGWHWSRRGERQSPLEPPVKEMLAMSTNPTEKVVAAPEQLGLESRTDFRRAAAELLEQLPEGAGRMIIDMSGRRQVASGGLGEIGRV